MVNGTLPQLDDFDHYVPRTNFPPDLIHFLLTFLFNVKSYIHNPLSSLQILKKFPFQNLQRIFKIPVFNLLSYPWEIFSQFQLNLVELVSRQVYILPLPFLSELLTGVNIVIDPFNFHHIIFIFIVKVYICIISSLLYNFLYLLLYIYLQPPLPSIKPSVHALRRPRPNAYHRWDNFA